MKTTSNTNNLEIVVTTNLNKNIKNKTHKIVLTKTKVKDVEEFLFDLLPWWECKKVFKYGGRFRDVFIKHVLFYSDKVINPLVRNDLGENYYIVLAENLNVKTGECEDVYSLFREHKNTEGIDELKINISFREKTENKIEVKIRADKQALKEFLKKEEEENL